MKEITFTNPHRQKHFDFFNQMSQPHFSICANVDIGNLLFFLQKNKLPFTRSIVYLLSHIANSIPQFKQRIRNNEVVEHDLIHPSFSVATTNSDVFSFCEVEYTPDYQLFIQNAASQIALMQSNPSFEDEADRDDFVFMSAIPWVAFTGFTHAMHTPAVDSVPRIVWGKYFENNGTTLMPLSVQAHHAVVDGKHTGQFFQLFEELAAHPNEILV